MKTALFTILFLAIYILLIDVIKWTIKIYKYFKNKKK